MDTKKETMESREETVEESPKKKSGVNLKVVALIGMIALIAGVFGVAGQFTGKGIGGQGADGSEGSSSLNVWSMRTKACSHASLGGWNRDNNKRSTGTYQECSLACEFDPSCVSFSYNKANQSCFYFNTNCNEGESKPASSCKDTWCHYNLKRSPDIEIKQGNNGTVSCNVFCGADKMCVNSFNTATGKVSSCSAIPGLFQDGSKQLLCMCLNDSNVTAKGGNNGTVSCDYWCGSDKVCIKAINNHTRRVVGCSKTFSVLPNGHSLACTCKRDPAITRKGGNNGTVSCNYWCGADKVCVKAINTYTRRVVDCSKTTYALPGGRALECSCKSDPAITRKGGNNGTVSCDYWCGADKVCVKARNTYSKRVIGCSTVPSLLPNAKALECSCKSDPAITRKGGNNGTVSCNYWCGADKVCVKASNTYTKRVIGCSNVPSLLPNAKALECTCKKEANSYSKPNNNGTVSCNAHCGSVDVCVRAVNSYTRREIKCSDTPGQLPNQRTLQCSCQRPVNSNQTVIMSVTQHNFWEMRVDVELSTTPTRVLTNQRLSDCQRECDADESCRSFSFKMKGRTCSFYDKTCTQGTKTLASDCLAETCHYNKYTPSLTSYPKATSLRKNLEDIEGELAKTRKHIDEKCHKPVKTAQEDYVHKVWEQLNSTVGMLQDTETSLAVIKGAAQPLRYLPKVGSIASRVYNAANSQQGNVRTIKNTVKTYEAKVKKLDDKLKALKENLQKVVDSYGKLEMNVGLARHCHGAIQAVLQFVKNSSVNYRYEDASGVTDQNIVVPVKKWSKDVNNTIDSFEQGIRNQLASWKAELPKLQGFYPSLNGYRNTIRAIRGFFDELNRVLNYSIKIDLWLFTIELPSIRDVLNTWNSIVRKYAAFLGEINKAIDSLLKPVLGNLGIRFPSLSLNIDFGTLDGLIRTIKARINELERKIDEWKAKAEEMKTAMSSCEGFASTFGAKDVTCRPLPNNTVVRSDNPHDRAIYVIRGGAKRHVSPVGWKHCQFKAYQIKIVSSKCLSLMPNGASLNHCDAITEYLRTKACSHDSVGWGSATSRSLRNSSLENCAKVCNQDPNCEGFSYKKEIRKCYFVSKKCTLSVKEGLYCNETWCHYNKKK